LVGLRAGSILPLALAFGMFLWTAVGLAGTATATTQAANQSATVSVQCSVALQLGNTTLAFGTVPPGQKSSSTSTVIYWTDTCGSTFTATAAATDLVDYATGATGPTTATSGTSGGCGGSIGCIPLYDANIGLHIGAPTCVSASGGSCSGATLPTQGASTNFALGTNCVDVIPGVDLSCPDTVLFGTSGGYTAGEYGQTLEYTLAVPANAQTGNYTGWVQYTITG
jgi:hypothetical protein